MKKLLPQANSINRVIDVFIYYGCRKNCSIQDIASFCEFEPRQAQYYLNAAVYLDLLDENLQVTDFGKRMLENSSDIKRSIYERIIADDVIGKLFAHMLLYPQEDPKVFGTSFLSPLFPEYGEAVIQRRLSTLITWCKEVIDYVNNK